MAKWIAVLLVVAVLMGGLWFATGGGDSPASIGGRAPALDRTTSDDAELVVRPDEETSTTDVGKQRADQADATRSEASAEIEVRVVRDESGEPLGGARILFLDRTALPAWRDKWMSSTGRDTLFRQYGRRIPTDPFGIARVPFTTSGALVGRVPGTWGEVQWSAAPSGGIELRLALEVDLRVRVVDPAGRPQSGVRLSIVHEAQHETKQVRSRQTAAPLGIATFARLRRDIGETPPGSRIVVAFPFPCLDAPELEIDPDRLPAEVQDLVLPPTGQMLVEIVDGVGAPIDEVVNVHLGIPAATESESMRTEIQMRLVQGRATFPHVGVGATVVLLVDGSRERPPLRVERPGPERAGGETFVRLEWTDRYPTLVGRAVDENGEVLRQQRGRSVLQLGAESRPGPPMTTDEQGHFRVVVTEPWKRGGDRRLEVTLFPVRGAPPLRAVMDLSYALESRDVEVGELTFRPLPAIVEGSVLDPNGDPVFGAHVRVEVGVDEGWRIVPELSASSNPQGRFQVFGESRASQLRLVVVRRGFQNGQLEPVLPGATGVTVVLEPAPSIGRDGDR